MLSWAIMHHLLLSRPLCTLFDARIDQWPLFFLQVCIRELLVELQLWGVWLLVTSRSTMSIGFRGAKQLHLQPLAQESAEALLRHHAGKDLEADHVRDLVKLCQCNSLYLYVIGGLLCSGAVLPEVRGVCIIGSSWCCFR